jgi:hypothetical protein
MERKISLLSEMLGRSVKSLDEFRESLQPVTEDVEGGGVPK